MLFGLAYYYDDRSLFQTGFDVFSAAFETPVAAEPLLAGRLHLRCGRAAYRLGQPERSRFHLEASLETLRDEPFCP